MDKKQLKKLANNQICGNLCSNMEFAINFRAITGKLATYVKLNKIKKMVVQEIEEEKITEENEVLERAYDLIYELYEKEINKKEVKTQIEKQENNTPIITQPNQKEENNACLEAIINKGKVPIELPYTSGGIMLGYGTGTGRGMWGVGSRLGEATTQWRTYDCYLVPGGLSIEKTGDFISFNKILNYHKGERKGLLIKHTNITLELAGEKTFTFRLWDSNMALLKIIEANMRKEEPKQIEKQENTDNIDQLIKAKELLDAGLLTMEEFNKLKEKLLF